MSTPSLSSPRQTLDHSEEPQQQTDSVYGNVEQLIAKDTDISMVCTDKSCDSKQDMEGAQMVSTPRSFSLPSESIPNVDDILSVNGYAYHRKIASTLQGEIFEAIDKNHNDQIVVIKKANKQMVDSGITIKNGHIIKIKEDIKREIEIQTYLQHGKNTPAQHIKLLKVMEDQNDIYVVTEHGGCDYFKWICHAHKQLEAGSVSHSYWKKNVRFLFKQIVEYTLWLHQAKNVCHLDISLENLLIKNGDFFYQTNRFSYAQTMKICDFGLAEYFDGNSNFLCTKHVGKEPYMAPEVYCRRSKFDARKADAWTLGVVLFIMITGAPAYNVPDRRKDKSYRFIVSGGIPILLRQWRRSHYMSNKALDLLQQIFIEDPCKRLSVAQILSHSYLQ